MSQNKPEQLLLPIPYRKAYNRGSFFISESNKAAVNIIDEYPNWKTPALIIVGPKESGKSHLCHVLKEKDYNINIYEDIDKNLDEELLFHQLNRFDEKTVITSSVMPNLLNIKLDDLKTRLNAQIIVRIENPDDALINAIIIKHFIDKGIIIKPHIIRYIARHSERSFSFLSKIIEKVAKKSSQEKRKITVSMIDKLLTNNDFL